jgi:hypothetical protein
MRNEQEQNVPASMVTIPLNEYLELKEIKEGLIKDENIIEMYRNEFGFRIYKQNNEEYFNWLLSRFAKSGERQKKLESEISKVKMMTVRQFRLWRDRSMNL